MSFWERYEKLCTDAGYKPGSEQAAQVIGTNRGTISAWKKSGNPPTPDILARIADAYDVSTDYLLGRTAEFSNAQFDDLSAGKKKAVASQKATAKDAEHEATPTGIALYMQLDDIDRVKAEAFIQGLLAQDKYLKRRLAL